jgi:hypothetical protein
MKTHKTLVLLTLAILCFSINVFAQSNLTFSSKLILLKAGGEQPPTDGDNFFINVDVTNSGDKITPPKAKWSIGVKIEVNDKNYTEQKVIDYFNNLNTSIFSGSASDYERLKRYAEYQAFNWQIPLKPGETRTFSYAMPVKYSSLVKYEITVIADFFDNVLELKEADNQIIFKHGPAPILGFISTK